jgi:glycosyltransferase involved in cell wall biosynthesis
MAPDKMYFGDSPVRQLMSFPRLPTWGARHPAAAGLAEGISALLDRLHAEGETLRIANRARIEAEFSLERIVSDYEALMRDLVHPSQSAQFAAGER